KDAPAGGRSGWADDLRAKRDFTITAEPAPGEPRTITAAPLFVVQKHAAKRAGTADRKGLPRARTQKRATGLPRRPGSFSAIGLSAHHETRASVHAPAK